jgi:hypothetical protein
MMGCSADNLAKTESAVENMADGPAKFGAQREIAQAQDATLGGKAGACAMHLSRAMHGGSLAEYQDPVQAPYQTQTSYQSSSKPIPAAK